MSIIKPIPIRILLSRRYYSIPDFYRRYLVAMILKPLGIKSAISAHPASAGQSITDNDQANAIRRLVAETTSSGAAQREISTGNNDLSFRQYRLRRQNNSEVMNAELPHNSPGRKGGVSSNVAQ